MYTKVFPFISFVDTCRGEVVLTFFLEIKLEPCVYSDFLRQACRALMTVIILISFLQIVPFVLVTLSRLRTKIRLRPGRSDSSLAALLHRLNTYSNFVRRFPIVQLKLRLLSGVLKYFPVLIKEHPGLEDLYNLRRVGACIVSRFSFSSQCSGFSISKNASATKATESGDKVF